jgi:predicted PurR-regulated permease PerM
MARRALAIWWIIALVVTVGLFWAVGGALAPYIVAGVFAYLLHPLVDHLERWGAHRGLASLLIVTLLVLILIGLILAAVPLIAGQLDAFIGSLPDYLEATQDWLASQAPGLMGDQRFLRDTLEAGEETLREHGVTLVAGLVASTARIVDVAIFLVLAPIVTFFLLLQWHAVVAWVDRLLPRAQAPTIRALATDIDGVLGGFVRGQFIVALIMTVYYSGALTLAGLNYAIAVGVVAGIGTLIPIVGATVGAVLAIGIALVQFWGDWYAIGLVAAVYFGGQLVEGNIITPRLVGRHVKLHPVWLLLAFSVFATLFGFLGVLVAVPVAAVAGVLVRFAIGCYIGSRLHSGVPDQPTTSPAVVQEGRS